MINEAFTRKAAFWTDEVIANPGPKKTIKSGGLGFDRDVDVSAIIRLRFLADRPVAVFRN